jgi:hypothetical protein
MPNTEPHFFAPLPFTIFQNPNNMHWKKIKPIWAPKNMTLPPCHEESPQYAAWNSRVEALEEAGLDRSDAQGIADLEFSQN